MKRLYLLLWGLAPLPGFSQSACEPLVYRNLNGAHAAAAIGNGPSGPVNFSGFQFAGASENACSPLYSASFCVTGVDSLGQVYAAGQIYDQYDSDFYPGVIRAGGNTYDCGSGFIYTSAAPHSRQELYLNNFEVMSLHTSGYDIYNVITGAVTAHISLVPRSQGRALLLPGGKVLVYGDPVSGNPLPVALVDVNSHTEVIGPLLLHPHTGSEAIVLNDGRVLISGIAGAEIFDPVTMQSIATPFPLFGLAHSKMGLLPDGRVIKFCGGGLNGFPMLSEVEIFDPVAMSWTVAASTLEGRGLFDLVPLGNGRFLLAGGVVSGRPVEIYDALSQTSIAYGDTIVAPRETRAVLLSNGEVFMWGLSHSGEEVMHIFNPVSLTFRDFELIDNPGFKPTGALLPNGFVFMQVKQNQHALFDPGTGSFLNLYRYHHLWKVSRDQRDAFLNDVQNGAPDFSQYPDIHSWPGNGLHWLGEDFQLAPYSDLNQNGNYDPHDGESPCLPGDQNLWWTFHDDGEHHASFGSSMGLQVEATAYSFDCEHSPCPDSVMKNALFFHYEVSNQSALDYHEVYLGLLANWPAAYEDNRMFFGCDSTLNLVFQYGTDTATYCGGEAPIATGIVFLNDGGRPALNHFIMAGQQIPPSSDPQYHRMLRSIWGNGDHLVANGLNGEPNTAAGPEINFQYPGDPGACGNSSGWIMAYPLPFQTLTSQSAGPFELPAGESIAFDYAVLWTQNKDNLSSLCDLKQSTAIIANWWQQQSWDCFHPVVTDAHSPADQSLRFYPNPAQDLVTIELTAGDHLLRLSDLSGQLLREWKVKESNPALSLQGLASGLYLLQVDEAVARLAICR